MTHHLGWDVYMHESVIRGNCYCQEQSPKIQSCTKVVRASVWDLQMAFTAK